MKLLIVDDEPDLRELISFAVESKLNLTTVTAQSGNEAIKLINSDPDIQAVISDYHMADGTGGELFNFLSREKPKVPFILCTSLDVDSLPEFKIKKPTVFIGKPFRWEDLVGTIKRVVLGDDASRTLEEAEYFPVRLKTLVCVNIVDSDIYIRLADKKFVKLIKKGDPFTPDDYKTYKARNIDYFYMKRNECDQFLTKFTTELSTLSLAKSLPWNSSCQVLEGAYESVYETIKTFGFTEEAQGLAKASAKLAIKTVMHLPKLSELFLKSDSSQFLYRHSALLAQLSCLIASAVGWSSESTQYKLALASFLHDMAIKDNDLATLETTFSANNNYPKEDEEKMARFRKHADETALLVSGLKEIPTEVSDIILHHHERPDGSGIPRGLTSKDIGPLASLFIVAQDVTYFIWEKKGNATFSEFLKIHQKDYSGEFFEKITARLATV
jgi:response regulator RpfG family c-di-GMP phosphodiesterase